MDTEEIVTLIRRAGEGDRTAWNTIVDEYSPLLWSVAHSFRLGEAQAADVVQTTWLRLIEHLDSIRDVTRLAGWLRTTAYRVCLETIRESRRECPTDMQYSAEPVPSRSIDLRDDSPEDSVLYLERETLVRQALAGLPERHRLLLELLVASPPLSYEEIGARLDMPIGSIGPTRARILARLRTSLVAELHDLALR